MRQPTTGHTGAIEETIRGIVERVTYHNADNGFSILRVSPFANPLRQETVVVHQTKVFAGATMEFKGAWTAHPQYGRQFQATQAIERKPATSAALEKYLGSGLIKGVGPKTAKRIVAHFGEQTLAVFEGEKERLLEVPGIARKKLEMISTAWAAHRAIRDVMMFLQQHGISTLFAVRIYRQYGDRAIASVTEDPYRLAQDIYGIGFFSADKVALSIGLAADSPQRVMAGIRHVLAASRDFGHCYLTASQIEAQVGELLHLEVGGRLPALLDQMEQDGRLMVRHLAVPGQGTVACYYAKSLFFDEVYVAQRVARHGPAPSLDTHRVRHWIDRYCASHTLSLSEEQAAAVTKIAGERFSILTGGPGCGKTTTTLVLVHLLEAMGFKVVLAAPTGRAAQRMAEVIGREAKTIHRLLEWQQGTFKKNEQEPLAADFLIVDECSMLDISLTASLLRAVPQHSQVLLIGDADQLPSVGAGNVLHDLIASQQIPCFHLSKVFRQARQSLIVQYAHQINSGALPSIDSPFNKPALWRNKADCLFIDAVEATREQLTFIGKVKRLQARTRDTLPEDEANLYAFRTNEPLVPYEPGFVVPKKFQHVNLEAIHGAHTDIDALRAVLGKVHPWSALHYGLTASDTVCKLYLEWIPKYFGPHCEIQVLSPMTRGSLGTHSLNRMLQEAANPPREGKAQLTVGERLFRVGDRVIHRKNNYELGVFNGDIGRITHLDNEELTCVVSFFPDHREVVYRKEDIVELELAYAITIHKAQGSEFEAVILPVLPQHFKMLFRNLIYTGLTRARRLAVFVGTRKALAMAVRNQDTSRRQTALGELLVNEAKRDR
ncbi:helicase, RecD/TraA family [Desulfobulbus propionicus DSM 2032]|jgi:exodeoxyribonuclease V alpha subunit|uniref:Helicase, RecD/TraA family n=1 Tax=Desulfobulbus propionicus (strain ATCC 33891 / DSM 2032 / VKM B-1956 / 1pr3) TaxID=577650 RepID=A0A7U3YJP6_DESPD|nr:AAA family ATPase [Desulfobulbus propionicus]ADW16641.1 helicase, RecD/TraA family [Desulfobulbus propionicus DSM 2032]